MNFYYLGVVGIQNNQGVSQLAFICVNTTNRRQSKTLILSTNVDQTSLETELVIAIYHPTGDKW